MCLEVFRSSPPSSVLRWPHGRGFERRGEWWWGRNSILFYGC